MIGVNLIEDVDFDYDKYNVGVEGIFPQKNDLKEELITQFEKIRLVGISGMTGLSSNFDSYTYLKVDKTLTPVKEIEKIILKYTNIRVKHYASNSIAYACLPFGMDANSVVATNLTDKYNLLANYKPQVMECESRQADVDCVGAFIQKKFVSDSDALDNAIDIKGIKVDRKKGRIEGLPDDHMLALFVNFKILNQVQLTAAEMAAVLMHEIGHMFTVLEYTGRVTTEITSVNDKIKSLNDSVEEQITIVAGGDPKKDGVGLVNATKVIQRTLDRQSKYIDDLGYGRKPLADSEHQADSFSVMYGFGRELSDALHKISGKNDNPLLREYGKFMMSQFSDHLVTTIFSIILIPGLWVLIMLISLAIITITYAIDYMFSSVTGEYDTYHDRTLRIKQEMIEGLRRSGHMTEKDKDEAIKVIESLNTRISDAKEVSLVKQFGNWLATSKKERNEDDITNKLESLLNNELHIYRLKERK